jgi:AcrR family transcriptional regulator
MTERDRRRLPRQKRSQETHDAIVEAAGRVFAEAGLEKATIARIAELAGVSPGSLYQYFPSKETLVTALFERESDAVQRRFLELGAELGLDDVPRLVRAFVAHMVDTIERNHDLYRVLIDEVPRVSGLEPTLAIDHRAALALRILIEVGKTRVQARDREQAAMMLVRTCR